METIDYRLEKRHGLVVVHRPFCDDAAYDLDAAKMTLENIIMNQKSFATYETYQVQVNLFRKVIAMFGEPTQAKG